MDERRVIFKLGVVYQTPRQKLERIPGMVREIIEGQDPVRFDRAHLIGYGDFSLDFEFVYYVLDRDYNVFRDIHQNILLGIYGVFEEEGVEFAYPTQTVFLEKGESKGNAEPAPA